MTRKYLKIPGRRMVLTKRMIEDAIKNTQSNAEAARWLDVSYNTYKKWSKYYNLFDENLNPTGKGISKVRKLTKYKLEDILDNKYINYSISLLKKRLINEGYFEEECSVCGYNEERVTDGKICLSLDFIDDNSNNYSFDNLRLLCPNCYFTNVGNFKNSKSFCK